MFINAYWNMILAWKNQYDLLLWLKWKMPYGLKWKNEGENISCYTKGIKPTNRRVNLKIGVHFKIS